MYMYKTDITIKAAVLLRKYLREISGLWGCGVVGMWGCGVDKYAKGLRMGGHLVASFSLLFLESWGMGFFTYSFSTFWIEVVLGYLTIFTCTYKGEEEQGHLRKKKASKLMDPAPFIASFSDQCPSYHTKAINLLNIIFASQGFQYLCSFNYHE